MRAWGMADALPQDAIVDRLAQRPGWELVGGKLHRELRFDDFAAAFGFMASVALVAEKMDHHPEWRNVWNTVEIDLTTHSAGGVTDADFTLAERIDELA